MEQLKKQVRRAQWYLGVQRFVGVLGWCCFATLLVALALIVVDKFWPTGVEPWVWGSVALALGLMAAVAWAIWSGRGQIDAAIEIDRRFGLKERVSSTLAMSRHQRESDAGQALLEDALRRVERIDVHEHFKVSPGRQVFLPLLPGVLAVLVALLVSPAVVDKSAAADTEAVKKQVKNSSDSLRKKLIQQRKRAEKQGLKDTRELFRRLERGAEELAAKNPGDRKQALVKLNELARELQKRRRDLSGADSIQKQLRQLKNITQGPADKFLRQISRGEFDKALQQLNELQADLAQGKLSEKQQQELAKQLEEMQKKLQDLIDAQRAAENDLQNRINQGRQAGREDEAEKLQQQLNELRLQLPQMNQLQGLADKLGRCSECLKDGQLMDANAMFSDIQADLNSLQQQLQELQMLDEAMDQLAQCRNQMNCPMCGGAGCQGCMGAGMGEGQGVGMGAGQGVGPRPEEQTDVKFRDSSTPQQTGRGSASVVGQVDGPNVKGDVQQQIKEQFDTARREKPDPLTGQRLPRRHAQHVRQYFDRFREGE